MVLIDRIQSVMAAHLRPFTRIRGAYRVCGVVNRAFLNSGASPIKMARLVDNDFIVLDLRSGTEWYTFYSGRYDELEIELIKLLVAEHGDFLDVGGNIGIYSVRLGRFLAPIGKKVYCFEPVPANRERIDRNVKLNSLE